ncbi:MAG TPA: 30S ribosomal protein S3 [Thermoplasmatales archaeon]|nr:30S ribosomal protein S3 [Candidatus Thermoplasmatota archaeon]MDD5778100.1 30S ribosomal protein S3 [Candidatus Thermoplasmatota archaeon]HDS59344.1 30S ribosomal protein S3 [Thermoplasmatales archaeon]
MAVERKFVQEGEKRMLIKEYLRKETERAGFGGLTIQRTPMGTLISLVTERPGIVIGRGGRNIKELTANLAEKFHLENPQVEIEEIGNKAPLNGQIMAHKVATALERGWHFRRVGHSTVRRIIESGARGCQVIISGKITGARHRTEKFTKGHVKYCGEVANQVMDTGMTVAKKKPGVLGIKVRIMKPGMKMPDEVEIFTQVPEEEPAERAKAEDEVEEQPEEVAVAEPEPEPKKEKKPAKKKPVKKEEKVTKEEGAEDKFAHLSLKDLEGVGETMLRRLKKAGVQDVRELYEMSVEDLVGIKGIGVTKAKQLKEAVEKAVKK